MNEFTEGVTAPEGEQSEETPTEDYLANWVGEGKKFVDVNEAAKFLAKKAANADKFIEELKQEKLQIESQYTQVQTRNKSIDEIVEALKRPAAQPAAPVAQQQAPAQPSVSVEEVLRQFKEEQVKEAQQAQKKQAVESAWAKLDVAFSSRDRAKEVVREYIGSNDARKAVVDSMAIADPEGLVKLLAGIKKPAAFTEDSSGFRTPSFVGGGTLTWEEVDKVRKENPKVYHSPAFRKRMREELN